MSDSQALVISNDFAVARTSKSGKTAYRGVLGVITSGNAAERLQLSNGAVASMIANNNFRGLMREVVRVFPVKAIRNAPGVIFSSGGKTGVDSVQFGEKQADGRWVYEAFDPVNPNKATSHAYARAVMHIAQVAASADKAFKGEKGVYVALLGGMLEREAARVAELTSPTTEPDAAWMAGQPSAEVVDA